MYFDHKVIKSNTFHGFLYLQLVEFYGKRFSVGFFGHVDIYGNVAEEEIAGGHVQPKGH